MKSKLSSKLPDYTRTYFEVAEIDNLILNKATDDNFKDEYKTIISMYYLLGDFYGDWLVTNNDLSTFYANENLYNALSIERLPLIERVAKLLKLLNNNTFDLNDQYLTEKIASITQSKKNPSIKSYKPLISPSSNQNKIINKSDIKSPDIAKSKTDVSSQLTIAKSKISRHLSLILELYTLITRSQDSFDNNKVPDKSIYKSIKENGYAVERNFLSKKNLIKLQTITSKIAKRERKSGNAYLYGTGNTNQRIYNLISKDKIYRDLLESRYFHTLLNNIFYRHTFHAKYGLSSLAAHIVAPGGNAIPVHIDSAVPETNKHRKPSLIPPWMIRFIMIINLVDFKGEGDGSSAILPKTQKLCRKPREEDITKSRGPAARSKEIFLTAPAGSLIMWDGLMWHRSTPNKSRIPRSVLISSFAPSFFREICGEEQYLEIVPPKLREKMTPRLRQLIGVNRGIKKGATYMLKNN